ncbi:hypothetical protein RJ641_023825 [Dillenia turbinata]|uniref:Uncharacterized protein n=1 Tax=Dillenia turbinata TaxID=194707 RepID=A0AAN8YT52_9MAGN
MEKRQLFLRSYQFSRKQSLTERIKRSLFRVKRVVCRRIKSARKIRKLVWFRLRFAFYRRRKFLRLLNSNNNYRCSFLLLILEIKSNQMLNGNCNSIAIVYEY